MSRPNTGNTMKEEEVSSSFHQSDQEKAFSRSESPGGVRQTSDPTGPPPPKFSLGFWDPRMAPFRKAYLKAVMGFFAMLVLMCWTILPLYWGSWYKEFKEAPHLKTWIVNLDQSTVGNAVTSFILASNRGVNGQHGVGVSDARMWLGWEEYTPSREGYTLAQLEQDIHDEKAWAAVFIDSGTTVRTLDAFNGLGLATFNSSTGISLVYNQGRNEQATGSFINPISAALLQQVTANLSATFAEQFVGNVSSLPNAVDISARLLSIPPQVLTRSVSFQQINIHPYDVAIGSVVTFVCLIYLCVFAFQLCMASEGMLGIVRDRMKLKSYLILRFAVCSLFYFVISLCFMALGVIFGADMTRHYGYGGPFIYWALLFCGMLALGLALEAAVTILTTRFIAPFFMFWLLFNLSVVSIPHELQAGLFKYGLGAPTYNLSRVTRAVLYGTKNDIGLNFGIVLAWAALSVGTTTLATIWQRRKAIQEEQAVQAESSKRKGSSSQTPREGGEKQNDSVA